MSGAGLVDLARKFVELSEQVEATRGEIARAVLNREGPRANPIRAARPGVKGSRASHHANAVKGAAAEADLLERLKATPGLRTAALEKATSAPVVTVQDRLRRLRARGAVAGGGSGGWTATAP
jgi:hypothetical protein